MAAKELVIETETKDGKGRSFSAYLLAYCTTGALWDGGGSNETRPTWMMLGGSDQELRAFVTNLRLGKKAELRSSGYSRSKERFETLKTAPFQVSWQRTSVGAIATVYLPDIFKIDPGMVDPSGCKFCILPTKEWLGASKMPTEGPIRHVLPFVTALACRKDYGPKIDLTEEQLRELVPVSLLFATYLDRRTKCPLVADPAFYLQILICAVAQGYCAFTKQDSYAREWGRGVPGPEGYNLEAVGISRWALGCSFTHEALETFLAEQVTYYFQMKGMS